MPLRTPEDAIRDALARLRAGAGRLALVAPAGEERAGALRELRQRLRPAFRPALIPFPALPAGEVASWALGLLNVAPQGDPERRLAEVARRGPGPVVLVLDEAEALPVATARRLAHLVERSAGHLRLVAVCGPDARVPRVLEALGGPIVLRLGEARAERPASLPEVGADEPTASASAGPAEAVPLPGAAPRRDPLATVADPDRDRPRPALARVVEAAAADLAGGAPLTVVTGAPGAGKTLALRLLARRAGADASVAWLPYPALAPADALAWIASLLDLPGPDAEARLREAFAGSGPESGRRALVIVDEAASLPEPTRDRLVALARETPGLQLVLGWNDGPPTAPARVLGAGVPVHAIAEPLDPPAAAELLRGRLGARAAAPLLAPERLGALHEESRGNPALLLLRADAALRRVREALPPPPAAPATPADADVAPAAPLGPAPSPPPGWDRPPRWRGLRPALALACLLGSAAVFTPTLLGRDAPAPPAATRAAASPPRATGEPPGDATAPPPMASPGSGAPSTAAAAEAPGVAHTDPSAPAAARPEPPPVRIHINANPWARIVIDGREVGVTPVGNVPVSPGPHRLRAHLADGRVIEREIVVDPANPYLVIEPDAP